MFKVMTPLERVLSVREGAFVQVYSEERLEGLVVVTVSLQDMDIDEDKEAHTVVSFEKGSLVEALEALDAWLAVRLMEAAACAFWELGGGEVAHENGGKKQKTPTERKKERKKEKA